MTKPITLITGASAGLGAEFARQYAARGHRLVLVARRRERIEALASDLGNARAVAMDLSAPHAASRLLADIASAGEQVGTLVNNAGFGLVGAFDALDNARQRQMIDLNCGLLTELAHGVIPGMKRFGHGGILNVASVAGFQPGPGMAVYFATKAYVLAFTEALHEELRKSNIHVSALCPGPTATEFGDVAGFGGNSAVDAVKMTAEQVVAAGIKGLEADKAVVVPGIANKISANSSRFLTRKAVRKIVGLIKK
ncbi:SDR family NAD(P)-dependent oxidoreductase [Sphingomicrobium astaxanthinifaciens]|uniref:SDR family NAD(P)-dependent oxidoreductase n=1 Tax=Sphingomicrobium astaxanthinifaciens TaxID=1227949 RepID=UPI001FCB1252|nr:SDR family oxidoreductase [Sphingomicrobium astaxanthinifaciens]MCJ7421353.1 SDR family oxidoreductase [Sphingomicrobium astaxanthinifaciens]